MRGALSACLLLCTTMACVAADRAGTSLAPAPPMGWNSWDSYGTTVGEADVRAAAQWIAKHLKRHGWRYVVVDMEWFVTNPTPAGNSRASQFALDGYGRYVPAPNRFPSSINNAGFKPLADYVHGLGLRFGLHILRGVPKEAVARNLPIEGSPQHVGDAADPGDTCPWNPDNFGTKADSAAAQAYYDSLAQLYAGWGVDLVKVDCIASRPYKGDDIRMFSAALRKTRRPIVLSLSPGEAPLDQLAELRQYAEMWRISDDVWDLWHSNVAYPQGLGDQFPRVAKWAPLAQPGHWPDADMLPLGYLGPAPGLGRPRQSRLTRDEQRTFMTLWCIARSPLMWGGNPAQVDDWTLSLLTNQEVLAVDQHSRSSREVLRNEDLALWIAEPGSGKRFYLAVFNLQNTAQKVQLRWQDVGLPAGRYKARDLWMHRGLSPTESLAAELPPHGSILYRVDRK